jgi:hypothetical protein
MPAGGSVQGVTIKGRYFPVDAESDVNKTLSGFTNEIKPNGDGSQRMIKSVKTGKLESIKVQIDNARQDLEFLQEVADSLDFVDVDLTEIDGTIYSGSMQLTGDIKASTKESTAEITLEGTLAQQ